jgi:hypothetical protein
MPGDRRGLLQPRDGADGAVPPRHFGTWPADGTVGRTREERLIKAAITPGTTFANYCVESLLGTAGWLWSISRRTYRSSDLSR